MDQKGCSETAKQLMSERGLQHAYLRVTMHARNYVAQSTGNYPTGTVQPVPIGGYADAGGSRVGPVA